MSGIINVTAQCGVAIITILPRPLLPLQVCTLAHPKPEMSVVGMQVSAYAPVCIPANGEYQFGKYQKSRSKPNNNL